MSPDPARLQARKPGRRLSFDWWLSSFSAMLHAAAGEAAAVDHDARSMPDPGVPALPTTPVEDNDVLHFPKGPAAGDCMHAVFETIDFTDTSSWDSAIEYALRAHPQRLAHTEDVDQMPRLMAMLRTMLDAVVDTELFAGFRLAQLPHARRRTELAFHMQAHKITADALNRFLQRHGYNCPQLGFSELRGYLNGFIDLVFEAGGKYYVLDWKSNHLGFSPDDYTPDRCRLAMDREGYHLQHLIYTVALHRYLQLRLPDYDYDRHFGGVLYLFVRGVRPSWRAGDNRCGVFFHRPEQAVITELDYLLAPVSEESCT
jgi:exodeoxyribonuclease V beta subunit